MSGGVPNPLLTLFPIASSQIASAPAGASVGVFRRPTDPLYYASLTLKNIVGGSAYRVIRADTGAELVAPATASGSGLVDVTISGVPCYANPQSVYVDVRKGTTAPKYQPYRGQADIPKAGGAAYIAQIPDPIA